MSLLKWRNRAWLGVILGFSACAHEDRETLAGGGRFQGRKLSAAEQMMWSTYVIGTKNSLATCFVVLHKDATSPGGFVPVVVTSVHSLRTARKGPWYLGLRYLDEAGTLQIAVAEFSPKKLPVRHPKHDIAAFELKMPAELAKIVPLRSFLQETAIGRPGDEPRVGREIALLGFPEVFPSTGGAFPMLRGGKVASYGAGMSRDPHRFVINAQVYPGDSGGPVFAVGRSGRPELIGMVTMRVGDQGNTVVPLAVAVDASVIRETLQLLDQPGRAKAPAASPLPAIAQGGG